MASAVASDLMLKAFYALGHGVMHILKSCRVEASALFAQLTPEVGALGLASFLLGVLMGRYRPIHTALDISHRDVRNKRRLAVFVVSVADGDSIRVRHRPLWACLRGLPAFKRVADSSIAVRVAAVDAPELPHFGQPGQPYAEEARQFVERRLLHRRATIKVLARDQYGRLVASVRYGMWPFRRGLSQELLKAGMAVVYKQSGAEIGFDGKQEDYRWLEEQARRKKLGLWKQGNKLVKPSEYKKDAKK